jgi:lysozyme
MPLINNIIDQLVRDEGFRSNPYVDTRGHNTVGIGHNLDANPLPNETYPLTVQRAKEILADDVARITGKLIAALPWADSLPEPRKGVLQNMSFNMGVNGLLEFKNTLHKIQMTDYAGAAIAMTQSAWYSQVGDRAKRLVQQMQTGEWV